MKKVIRILRGGLSGTFFVLYGLFALPFALLLPICPSRRLGRFGVRFFYQLFVATARITRLYDVRADKFPRDIKSGAIIVMNHLSLIDICVLLANIPDAVCIAKASAKKNPFLSAVVNKLFLANDKGGEEMVIEAGEYLKRGVHLVIFPQGTRGGEKVFRGAARLALATGARILAYRISYNPLVLAKNQPWWDVGDKVIKINLAYRGEIPVSGENNFHNAAKLTREIATLIS